MKKGKKKKPGEEGGTVRLWTLAKARESVKLVRATLQDLRITYISTWHLYRLNKYQPEGGKYGDEIKKVGDEGRRLLSEFDRIGVIAYQSPLRGIALFPFIAYFRDGNGTTPREAYYVYKDTRESISSYIFADNLCAFNDLYGWERPIPAKWEGKDAIPELEMKDFC